MTALQHTSHTGHGLITDDLLQVCVPLAEALSNEPDMTVVFEAATRLAQHLRAMADGADDIAARAFAQLAGAR